MRLRSLGFLVLLFAAPLAAQQPGKTYRSGIEHRAVDSVSANGYVFGKIVYKDSATYSLPRTFKVKLSTWNAGVWFVLPDTAPTPPPPPPPANIAPVAAFTAACVDLTCTFTDASTDSDGTIAARAWAFGDGATSTAANPAHTYSAAGTWQVALDVMDDDSASASIVKPVTVTAPALAQHDDVMVIQAHEAVCLRTTGLRRTVIGARGKQGEKK